MLFTNFECHPNFMLFTNFECQKEKHNGGIITLEAICQNQHGKPVAEGEGKMLVFNKSAVPGD